MKGITKVFCIISAILAFAAAVAAFLHFTGKLCCYTSCGDDCCGCSDEEDSIFEE